MHSRKPCRELNNELNSLSGVSLDPGFLRFPAYLMSLPQLASLSRALAFQLLLETFVRNSPKRQLSKARSCSKRTSGWTWQLSVLQALFRPYRPNALHHEACVSHDRSGAWLQSSHPELLPLFLSRASGLLSLPLALCLTLLGVAMGAFELLCVRATEHSCCLGASCTSSLLCCSPDASMLMVLLSPM